MVETQREKEDRLRREATRTDGTDPNLGAVNSLPTGRTTTTGTPTTETMRSDDRPLTEKVGDTLHGAKEDVKGAVAPDRTVPPPTRTTTTTTSTTRPADWEEIKHPGMVPRAEDPYGTRPVSELTPPSTVSDKADLAAVRMMDREKADRERMERERVMTSATTDAAAARAAMTSKEMTPAEMEAERERNRTRAAMAGGALAAGAAATRTEPAAGERTIRQGAAVDTPPSTTMHTTRITPAPSTTTTKETTTRVTPVPTVVPVTRVPPTTSTPMLSDRDRMHAEDPSVHPDWETQPQINAPRDVGIPTAEGQVDAARIQAGRRRSDEAEEPRIDRRGGDYEVPAASGARTGPMREQARDIKEDTKAKARDVKEDVDRKI